MTNEELVKALRILQDKNSLSYYKRQVCKDAADAIEELQAGVKRLNMRCADCEYASKPWPELEPKRGKWIVHTEVKNIYGGICVECPVCGDHFVVLNVSDEKYCRSCGAKMEVQE